MTHTPSNALNSGDHAVITGGSSGLGLELARRLAQRKLRVTLLARDPVKLADAVATITAAAPGADIRALAVDVSDSAALEEKFRSLLAATGGIDILINSAGILREGYFERLDDADFREVMEANFFGTVNTIRTALPYLERAERGRIVNIASVSGLTGVFGYTPYCAAKHAVVGFTESLRYELEPQGIALHLVCPGEFDSPMVDALEQHRTPENRRHTLLIPKLPIGRIADEIIDGVESGSRLIVPGRIARLAVAAQRLALRMSAAIARRRIAGVYVGPHH
ncbi:SDR family NAD(P)-dependent oxidoreductase [Nocardia sp. NPDC052112]|uniref:SDR family NAD(P)-dependent oxidoreductase n=1 Tax=Nocardia sp. NPDC052112 TaxID=3155646 RepID=UPI003424F9A0